MSEAVSQSKRAPGARWPVVAAFFLAAAAQAIKLVRVLPKGAFGLDVIAILALRRVFAALPEEEARAPMAPPALSAKRLAWVIGSLGTVVAVGCSFLLYRNFIRYLAPVLLVGPLALLAVAFGEDRLAGYSWRMPRPSFGTFLRHHRLLLLVLLAGAVFRFGPTGFFPPPDGFSSIEEMQRASGGFLILNGSRPWEFPLAQYLAAASFWLFGLSIYSLRLPVTLLGWLTLVVFYALAREIVRRPAALFATALLAVSRWHCQVGWYSEDVYVPLFPFVILLWLIVRTRRDPRPAWYVAAGAICGYLLYDYAAFRGTIGTAIGFFVLDALWQRRWPRDGRRVAMMLGVFALFLPPLVSVLDRGGTNFYTEALARSFADQGYYTSDRRQFVQQRIDRILMASDVFTSSDHAKFFATLNVPNQPLLDPFTGIFFTLGLGTTLLLPRRRFYFFFGWGFLVLATGAMVVTWNLDFRRLATLVPFVFLFAAFLANELHRWAEARGRGAQLRRTLGVVAVAAATWNAWFLAAVLTTDHAVRASHRTPYSVPLAYLRDHYDGQYVVLLSPETRNFFENNDYEWLKPPRLAGAWASGVEALLPVDPPPPKQRDLMILIARPYDIDTVISQVQDFYPAAECERLDDADHTRHDLGVCRIRTR